MEALEDVDLRDTHQNKLSTSWKPLHSLMTNGFVPSTAMRRNMALFCELALLFFTGKYASLGSTLTEYRCEFLLWRTRSSVYVAPRLSTDTTSKLDTHAFLVPTEETGSFLCLSHSC